MFTRLIVPLDGSPEANIAVSHASQLAHLAKARVTLLRVLATSVPAADGIAFLTGIAHDDELAGVEVDIQVRHGDPGRVILDEITECQADLVVMRTRGRAGLARAVLGSVAERIVQHSPTPVLLLPPEATSSRGLETILVPVDGSPGGAVAVRVAHELAQASGARLRLLQVVVPLPLQFPLAMQEPVYFDPSWDADAEAAAHVYVDSLARRLSTGGVQADGRVLVEPTVPEAIVRMAKADAASMLVMSSQAHTGVARAILGSVTDAVVRSASSPILVIRRGPEPPAD
jgi:nucleotide-binding universal stress UspA family protein